MVIVLLVKFKKLFSTEKILERTHEAVNDMIRQIDYDAKNNLDIINQRIAQLNAVSAEADRHIEFLRSEIEKASKTKIFKEKIQKKTSDLPVQGNLFSSQDETMQTPFVKNPYGNSIKKKAVEPVEDKEPTVRDVLSDPEGNVSVPEFIVSPNPITPKKSFAQQVQELSRMGCSEEEIAARLNKSVQEIKFTLEFL